MRVIRISFRGFVESDMFVKLLENPPEIEDFVKKSVTGVGHEQKTGKIWGNTLLKKKKVLAGADAHLVWQHFTFGFPIAVMTSNRDCHHSRVKTSQIILVLEFQGSSVGWKSRSWPNESKMVSRRAETSTNH